MALDLTDQITKLQERKKWNLQGLIDCSIAYRSTPEFSPFCQSISLLGQGSYSTVYRLVFDDGIQLAASVFSSREDRFDSRAKQSELDTMKFVRESGLYPDIFVPNVHAWDTTFDNPVGAPYVLMDVVQGKILDTRGFNALTHVQRLSIVKSLAKLKAHLSKPVPFDTLGSIIADRTGEGFSVGPLASLSLKCRGGPFKSADELWRSSLQEGMLLATQEWCNIKKDKLPLRYSHTTCTPQIFTELFQLISALIPHFSIPQAYNTLVLHHPDIALRNIFFDEESLSSDHPKITGVIDWAGAQILPLMLTATYPDDLITGANSPFTNDRLRLSRPPEHEPEFRPHPQHEAWLNVPYDWTFAGNSTLWPEIMLSGEPCDLTPRVSAAVRAFYLRAYFSACYAEQLHLLHGDASLPHATLFADAPYYLKFHEAVSNGWQSWVKHDIWIRETYWRLRNLAGQETGKGLLIIGPNIYRGSAEASVRNLEIPEDSVDTSQPEDITRYMINGVPIEY